MKTMRGSIAHSPLTMRRPTIAEMTCSTILAGLIILFIEQVGLREHITEGIASIDRASIVPFLLAMAMIFVLVLLIVNIVVYVEGRRRERLVSMEVAVVH